MLLAPIVDIFCDIDDFYKSHMKKFSARVLPSPTQQRDRLAEMSASEIMTILILFHMSHFRTFKDFYLECVLVDLHDAFPKAVSYPRFVSLMPRVLVALTDYVLSRAGKHTNMYYIDSSKLVVCHNKRIYRNKVFKGLATRGKSSMGWFYGFKLHIVINNEGELMSFCLTKGNTDDRKPVSKLMRNLEGLAAGDKGYIDKKLAEKLKGTGLRFITKVRKNMKKKMLNAFEKFFLASRTLVETVIEQLKSICQIEHSRHRSPINFLVNLVSGLAAYSLKPRKPSLKFEKIPPEMEALIHN